MVSRGGRSTVPGVLPPFPPPPGANKPTPGPPQVAPPGLRVRLDDKDVDKDVESEDNAAVITSSPPPSGELSPDTNNVEELEGTVLITGG